MELATGKSPLPADRNVGATEWRLTKTELARERTRTHALIMISGSSGTVPSHLVAGLHSRGVLPHLKREGAAYFITFRLAGTLPQNVLLKFKAERSALIAAAEAARRPLTWREQEELFGWYSARVDKYLDSGHGDCWLRQPEIAELIANAMRFHAGQRFDLRAWVVMPNHVHAVLRPQGDWTLSQILKSWKGFTAREANRRLHRAGNHFWQAESYDHLIRDDKDFFNCCRYTTMNPVKAGLCRRPEDWRCSSAFRAAT